MLSRLQYLVEGLFESSASVFKKAGFSPNLVTAVGFVLTAFTGVFYSTGQLQGWIWAAAVIFLVAAGYFDALDGAMARRYQKTSQFGGVLDSVLDRVGESVLYSGIALGGLVDFGLCLWALSAALIVSYVRARVEVEGVKLKGIGIAERPERLLILLLSTVLSSLYASSLGIGIALIAGLSTLTILDRVYKARNVLSRQRASST